MAIESMSFQFLMLINAPYVVDTFGYELMTLELTVMSGRNRIWLRESQVLKYDGP